MLLIADGNNLAWAGFHALRRAMEAETPEAKVRAALLGLTQSVLGFAIRRGEPPIPGRLPLALQPGLGGNAEPVHRLVVCFDEGRPWRRRSIFPGYQMGREADPNFIDNEPFVLDAIAAFTEACACTTIEIYRGENTEADDLVAAVVAQSSPGETIRIASTDRDFLQLVDDRLTIYSPVRRLVITPANFTEATAPRDSSDRPVAFPRERYLDYRVASGDASDNLPGIPGVGALTAARLLAYASLEDYFARPPLVTDALGRRNVKLEGALRTAEARETVARNRELMDLRLAATRYPDLSLYRSQGAWDESAFRGWVTGQRVAGLDLEAACITLAALR